MSSAALRVIALVGLVAVALGVVTTPASAQTRNEQPTATEIGVTDAEIHIAVMADVDNTIAPNVFVGARDAVEGFAKYINSSCATKNKCLAGRKLVVDFYDSQLNPNEVRNGQIKACTNDLAMVGTSALLVNSVDDMRNCKDHAGRTTGIPEIPAITSALVQQCSDESFPILPPTIECATTDQHPQTYVANVGRGYYFTRKYGDLHGVYVFSNDSPIGLVLQVASGIGGIRDAGGANKGVRSDADLTISGVDAQRQDALTPAVQALKAHSSNYAQCAIQYQCTVSLRKEAALQGITNQVKVWDCNSCYDKKFLSDGGTDVENTYVDDLYLPFYDPKEAKANPMLANFVRYTGKDNVDFGGAYAWGAAVAFRDAVNATVKTHGVNGLTRANLLAALNNIHQFDADGMLAPIDLAGRKTTDCHVLTQVRNGTFVRVEPTKPGTFDCNPKYVIKRKLDLLSGS
jgi:Periplasmic binding protein